ncbi:TonB family protein [Pedobacter petrophilus]|uniref:TonB family protein n=1 Tax=Pedobacter petrophilus TaxID=1908241 RepID=A0A7K0FZP8_9SPHI|nr:energy transducer TonB [Pedobacter petrophilus]MRX76554.1 TonB family protein [Pedobacter petrophilus]
MENKKFKILAFVLVISTISAFAQNKKLVKTFKLGTVGYNLYSQTGKSNSGSVDTSFYLLYRVGNTRTIVKEIKEITEKGNGKVQLKTTYEVFPNSIIFKRQGFTDDANRKYTQNSKGLLSFEKYSMPTPTSSSPAIAAVDNSDHLETVDVIPEYPGGINNARKYVGEYVHYPASAVENEVEGTIILAFVIEKDGSVTDIKIEKGLGFGLDEEVIRVMMKMPKWSPAKLNGKNVRYKMRMPVSFRLS